MKRETKSTILRNTLTFTEATCQDCMYKHITNIPFTLNSASAAGSIL